MNLTANYHLQKPLSNEKYNVAVQNTNMDILDSALNQTESKATLNESNLNTHTANFTNPHKVTKAQIGLGNVDNTPDSEKPVSAPQQTAINTAYQNAQNDLNQHKNNSALHITADERTAWNEAMTHAASAHAPTTAEENVQADWNETDTSADSFILHKPTTLSAFTNDLGFITQADIDVSQNHTHSNKGVLDTITQESINQWNAATAGTKIVYQTSEPTGSLASGMVWIE